jgi:hypothetical protein
MLVFYLLLVNISEVVHGITNMLDTWLKMSRTLFLYPYAYMDRQEQFSVWEI